MLTCNKRRLLLGVVILTMAGLTAPGEAQLPNLTYYYAPNWQYPILPTTLYCPLSNMVVPPTLPGNSSIYLNGNGINDGNAVAQDFYVCLYVDGEVSIEYWESDLDPGDFWGVCGYQTSIRGGRHTVELVCDNRDDVVESDETDNVWAHQFVFTPYVLSESTPKDRGAPPDAQGGWWSIVDGSSYDVNCDGFRFSSTGWWNVITLYSHGAVNDYDLELHAPSTGSENGFLGSSNGSYYLAGHLDALIVNGNTMGVSDYDVGVIDLFGTQESWFTIEHVVSQPAGVGSDMAVSLGTDDYLRIWDTYIGDTGWVTVSVDDPSADGELFFVGWAEHDATELALSDITGWEVTDENGQARLHRDFTTTGWYGLIVHRNPSDGGEAKTINVKIEPTPPDLMPIHMPGWHAPLMPTPEPVVTYPVPLPGVLHGFSPETYFSYAMENYSPSTCPAGNMWVLRDGMTPPAYNFTLPAIGPFTILIDFNTTGTEIPGGRHTLTMFIDPDDVIYELYEDNNTWGEQYCWSPLELTPGMLFSHPAPALYFGGWWSIETGETLHGNCDGYRLSTGSSAWEGMVLSQGPDSDYDLSAHYALVGVKEGFDDFVANSYFLAGETDYILFNNSLLEPGPYDVGVYHVSGEQAYTVEAVGSTTLPNPVSGNHGPFTMPIGNMLHLYNIYLNQDVYAFRLDNLAGSVDWGMNLHGHDEPMLDRSNIVTGGSTDQGGPGGDEWFTVEIPAAGWYGLAVFKVGPYEFEKEGSYELTIMQGVTDVPDGENLPSATALVGIFPNPFNPQTMISFDLASPEAVELAIYDMKGARVRRLGTGTMPAGRHEVVWNGTDDHGARVASGVYFAHFKAGSHRDIRKVMMVK